MVRRGPPLLFLAAGAGFAVSLLSYLCTFAGPAEGLGEPLGAALLLGVIVLFLLTPLVIRRLRRDSLSLFAAVPLWMRLFVVLICVSMLSSLILGRYRLSVKYHYPGAPQQRDDGTFVLSGQGGRVLREISREEFLDASDKYHRMNGSNSFAILVGLYSIAVAIHCAGMSGQVGSQASGSTDRDKRQG